MMKRERERAREGDKKDEIKEEIIWSLQPIASCAMPVLPGMKVKTDSPATRRAR